MFVLGEAETLDEAQRLIREFREPERVVSTLASSRRAWNQRLDTIRVRTPDPAMDILLNGWLIHQTLTCRVWARSAFYQSGGAFGFRDQLQDVMALILAEPAEVRMHLLRAASRQFVEGDVQHWWHPPTGRGVRTRISDDLLWLPYVVAYYINRTGDTGILEELVPYLKAPLLKSMQHEDYGLPGLAEESENLYEHCLKAIDHSNRLGAHGLPLMGTGDWNDGMNQVGAEGIGESVWLAWFRAATLDHFGEIASSRGDLGRVASMQEQATTLRAAIEATSWDGEWYMRAFFDDGTPLGSKANDECQIDSLPQTWAVIAGGGDPERAEMAMEKVLERLVRRNSRLILLFDPPFDTGTLRPGYIKGYLPGIRENGGQYTHAATWVALACAKLGRGRLAHEMFDLLNPIRRSDTPEAIARYRVEPYVLAGDIYGRPPHEGRGGWSWYTGSSGWLYRVGLHAILGFEKTGNRLRINPCIPAEWPGFEIQYHHGTSAYILRVVNPDGRESGVRSITVDGRETEGDEIELLDDGVTREVVVVMGPRLP